MSTQAAPSGLTLPEVFFSVWQSGTNVSQVNLFHNPSAAIQIQSANLSVTRSLIGLEMVEWWSNVISGDSNAIQITSNTNNGKEIVVTANGGTAWIELYGRVYNRFTGEYIGETKRITIISIELANSVSIASVTKNVQVGTLPKSYASGWPLEPGPTFLVLGYFGNYYFIQATFTALGPRCLFVKKSDSDLPRLEIPQDGDIGTFMAYMGYHTDTNPTAPIVQLREHARNAGRYSIANPEYYAQIDGRIVIATKKNIGGNFPVSIGDYVDVEFEVNGIISIYHCIIGEEKYAGATDNPWGHNNGACVVEIVYHDYSPPAGYNANKNNPWGTGRVISITKVGSYGSFM